MIQIESTSGCNQTPKVLFALEEMGVPYEWAARPDGYFVASYQRSGPRLLDDGLVLFESNALLRHVCRKYGKGRLWPSEEHRQAQVDQWLDFAVRLGAPVDRQFRRAESERKAEDMASITRYVGIANAALKQIGPQGWLVGEFSAADCAYVVVLDRALRITSAESFVAAREFLARLHARPAWQRVRAQLSWL
jgi:glutathione S-transferase